MSPVYNDQSDVSSAMLISLTVVEKHGTGSDVIISTKKCKRKHWAAKIERLRNFLIIKLTLSKRDFCFVEDFSLQTFPLSLVYNNQSDVIDGILVSLIVVRSSFLLEFGCVYCFSLQIFWLSLVYNGCKDVIDSN